MRILELNITNYRGFGETMKFNFSKNLTVIAGVNGKGKTAVLESACLILSRLLPHISPARSGYRNIGLLDIHEGTEEVVISIKANCAGIPLEYTLKYNKHKRKIELTKLPLQLRNQIKLAYGDPNRDNDQAPLVVYYSTDRAGYRFPKALPKAVPAGQAMAYNGALLNRTVDYKDFMVRFRVAAAQADEEAEVSIPNFFFGQNTLTSINDALKVFLDGFSNLHVQENPLRLVVNKNEETLDIRQLSDGERSFIAMICDLGRRLALANPDLPDPTFGAGVVFIDEIELHLHPRWQLEITEKLRTIFPNIQFIVTTHSPFILQSTREGEFVSLDSEFTIDPSGKSLEQVAKYVMDVENTEYSPRVKNMREVPRRYLQLAEDGKTALAGRKEEIQQEITLLLAPFSDNPAYTALLESKGIVTPED